MEAPSIKYPERLPFAENELPRRVTLILLVVIASDTSRIEAVLIVPVLEQRDVRVIDAAGKLCAINSAHNEENWLDSQNLNYRVQSQDGPQEMERN